MLASFAFFIKNFHTVNEQHGLRLKLLTLGVGDSLLLPLFSYCVNYSVAICQR